MTVREQSGHEGYLQIFTEELHRVGHQHIRDGGELPAVAVVFHVLQYCQQVNWPDWTDRTANQDQMKPFKGSLLASKRCWEYVFN